MSTTSRVEEESRLRQGICRVGALCYERRLISGAEGNISARLSDGSILITPSGVIKGMMQPHHLALIDGQGNVLNDGPGPSSESVMHLAVYTERPDIRAVVHAHPPHAVAMSIAEVDMQLPVIPEIVVTIGGIPTTRMATPGTPDLADSIREVVRCSDTLIMKNHGAVCLGDNLMDAYRKVDMVEHTAHILLLAHTVRGGLKPLEPEVVQRLLATRGMLGIETLNTLENRCGLPPRG